VPYLRAPAGRAVWAVRLAEVDARGTLVELRAAEAVWQELEAPYEAARTRLLVGRACGELGDGSEAEVSLAAAVAVFEQLGAGADLKRVEQMRARRASAGSRREQLRQREREPGHQLLAFEGACRRNDPRRTVGRANDRAACSGVYHPDQPRARAEVVRDLLLHIRPAVARRQDFDRQVGRTRNEVLGKPFGRQPGAADEGDVRPPDSVWGPLQDVACLNQHGAEAVPLHVVGEPRRESRGDKSSSAVTTRTG
jgi:hypothetical protein